MRLTQLEYFQAVCRTGNVTKAAEALYVSQPTITVGIQELEQEFNLNLFSRQKKKLFLTKEGQIFLEYSTAILKDVKKLSEQMEQCRSKNSLVRISVPLVIGVFLVPELFGEPNLSFPNTLLSIDEFSSAVAAKMVLSGDFDFSIVMLRDEMDEYFKTFPLIDSEVVCCVREKHPLAKRSSVTLDELNSFFPSQFYQVRTTLLASEMSDAGLDSSIMFRTNQVMTLANEMQNHDSCILSTKYSADHLDGIVGVPLDPPRPYPIGVIVKKGAVLSAGASMVLEHVLEHRF